MRELAKLLVWIEAQEPEVEGSTVLWRLSAAHVRRELRRRIAKLKKQRRVKS